MNFNFNEMGITLDNIKDFETQFAEFKKAMKENAKAVSAVNIQSAIDFANSEIEAGHIVKGATVIVKYDNKEVTGVVKNTPTVTAKNIPVNSDEFENKDKFLYVPKKFFVRVV